MNDAAGSLPFLVPKLLLGNEVLAQALLGRHNESRILFPLNYFAKRSFAAKGVPKRELGNQRRTIPVSAPVISAT
jgi:hypothetical protein